MKPRAETPRLIPAAEYIRVSTDHQYESAERQRRMIREYAETHNIEIVRTYSDIGKSGLHLKNRPALLTLLTAIEAGEIDFEKVLVYDISRWGRFQNADESAFCEFICTRAGVKVEYCFEPFANSNAPTATIYKAIKRTIAAEASREQSERISRALLKAASLGFSTGGERVFGYKRMLVAQDGTRSELREQPKSEVIRRAGHVVLFPGPADDVATVRRIFRLYVEGAYSPGQIAKLLNATGTRAGKSPHWTRSRIRYMLTNEKYIGTGVYNRSTGKLRTPRSRNPRDAWVRIPHAFAGLVSSELYAAAQRRAASRARSTDHQELLHQLHGLWREHGHLSVAILRSTPRRDSYQQIWRRLGSVKAAFAAIGYVQRPKRRDRRRLDARQAHEMRLTERLVSSFSALGYEVQLGRKPKVIVIEKTVVAIKCMAPVAGPSHLQSVWRSNAKKCGLATSVVVMRLDRAHGKVIDFMVLPREVAAIPFIINGRFPQQLLSYRRATFDDVTAALQRIVIRDRARINSAHSILPSYFRAAR